MMLYNWFQIVSGLSFLAVCDNGTYGLNCGFHCGACLNSEQCYHVNGACLNGCDPGFQGGSCKDSKILSQLLVFLFSEKQQMSCVTRHRQVNWETNFSFKMTAVYASGSVIYLKKKCFRCVSTLFRHIWSHISTPGIMS
jgi:hypothetical protein